MFAAVSSRGFAGLGGAPGEDGGGSDNDRPLDAMVPLLDLLDHRRGLGGARDVRYRRVPGTSSSSGNSDGSRGNDGGAALPAHVLVETDRPIEAGSILHDTYGAKGNAQLLLRYGFCLGAAAAEGEGGKTEEINVEPDGSSNDVLELRLKNGGGAAAAAKTLATVVELRAGPKSYSYGGFARAVEVFHPGLRPSSSVTSSMGETSRKKAGGEEEMDDGDEEDGEGDDDMEAFLNGCDDEEEGGGGGMCGMMYGEGEYDEDEDEDDGFGFMGGDGGAVGDGDSNAAIEAEIEALDGLIGALDRARGSYPRLLPEDRDDVKGNSDANKVSSSSVSPSTMAYAERCAAVLVRSEVRTIDFFREAAARVRRRLVRASSDDAAGPPASSEKTAVSAAENCSEKMAEGDGRVDDQKRSLASPSDSNPFEKYVGELADAFLAIRHPTVRS
mmetsp:Transcript_19343/g.56497  ORF Transcript_19343/g.56497 Transcript_19343/m.56497 type:complete len:443 (+) Transcript_19343:1867-3195(+)